MTVKDIDSRENIIKVTTILVNESADIESITVRQIAERAGVAVGAINYYFGSKDSLLSLVVGNILAKQATAFLHDNSEIDIDPVQKLKSMLEQLSSTAANKKSLRQFMLTQSIVNGDMQAPLYLVPVLQEIFGEEKEEIELRIIALQLLYPLQVGGITPEKLYLYSGLNLEDEIARRKFIDCLVDNIIGERRVKK